MGVQYYEDENLWFYLEGNIVTIGITDGAAEVLGSIDAVELPAQGDDFDKNEIICEIIGGNSNLKVVTPAAGFIHEVNETVLEEPELLIEAPTDEGWLVKIEIEDPTDLEEYKEE